MDDRILYYASQSDEIWHAGDFGSVDVVEKLQRAGLLKGVFGNIDNSQIRSAVPEIAFFTCESVKVLMVHIGGYPSKYSRLAKTKILEIKPNLFISGHSHILKAQYDQNHKLLHLNPGAAGKSGFHKVRTMMQFVIDGRDIKDLNIIELGAKI